MLAGRITRELDPAVFQDDLLFFAVERLEDDDPEWLRGRLRAADVPLHRRIVVARQLVGPLRDELAAELTLDA